MNLYQTLLLTCLLSPLALAGPHESGYYAQCHTFSELTACGRAALEGICQKLLTPPSADLRESSAAYAAVSVRDSTDTLPLHRYSMDSDATLETTPGLFPQVLDMLRGKSFGEQKTVHSAVSTLLNNSVTRARELTGLKPYETGWSVKQKLYARYASEYAKKHQQAAAIVKQIQQKYDQLEESKKRTEKMQDVFAQGGGFVRCLEDLYTTQLNIAAVPGCPNTAQGLQDLLRQSLQKVRVIPVDDTRVRGGTASSTTIDAVSLIQLLHERMRVEMQVAVRTPIQAQQKTLLEEKSRVENDHSLYEAYQSRFEQWQSAIQFVQSGKRFILKDVWVLGLCTDEQDLPHQSPAFVKWHTEVTAFLNTLHTQMTLSQYGLAVAPSERS